MWSRIWKVGMMTAALSGLLVLPACEEDPMDTEPLNNNTVDVEPVEPVTPDLDTDTDLDTDVDIRTAPPPTTPGQSTTPQDRPDIQIDQQQQSTTQPGQQGQQQQLEPLPPPQENQEQKKQQQNGEVQPLPQPGNTP